MPKLKTKKGVAKRFKITKSGKIKKRSAEWGAEELGHRLLRAWQAFVGKVHDPAGAWLQVEQHQGATAVQAAYRQILAGRGDPRRGHMLSLNDQA